MNGTRPIRWAGLVAGLVLITITGCTQTNSEADRAPLAEAQLGVPPRIPPGFIDNMAHGGTDAIERYHPRLATLGSAYNTARNGIRLPSSELANFDLVREQAEDRARDAAVETMREKIEEAECNILQQHLDAIEPSYDWPADLVPTYQPNSSAISQQDATRVGESAMRDLGGPVAVDALGQSVEVDGGQVPLALPAYVGRCTTAR